VHVVLMHCHYSSKLVNAKLTDGSIVRAWCDYTRTAPCGGMSNAMQPGDLDAVQMHCEMTL
jgi:hypothetical protein